MAQYMQAIAVSKKPISRENFVTIPRAEYTALLELKKTKEFTPTTAQKKALARAEQHLKKGETFSYGELVSKLGYSD